MQTSTHNPNSGFTLIEVVLAIVILAVGLLGLAATTVLNVRQVTAAEMATDRSMAVQTTVERIRSLDFDAIDAGTDSVGHYSTTWTSTLEDRSKVIQVISVGPGMQSVSGGLPKMSPTMTDTLTYRIIRP